MRPGTGGELPTQLVGLLAVIGEVVIVIASPQRLTSRGRAQTWLYVRRGSHMGGTRRAYARRIADQ